MVNGPRASGIRVLILTETRLYAEGLAESLTRSGRFLVVGLAHDEGSALALISKEVPDVAVVDMASSRGLAALRAMTAAEPGLEVVAVAVPETEREVLACVEAGMSGFVTRGASLDDLRAAIDAAMRGELTCSPRIARTLLDEVRRHSTGRPSTRVAPPGLTRRETEVVELIDRGLSNKEIAQRLYIGVSTVKNHIHNVLEKLHVRRRGEAAALLRDRLAAPAGNRGPH